MHILPSHSPAKMLMALLFLSLCVQAQEVRTNQAPKIGIVYTAPHPVINSIIDGFKGEVTKEFPGATFVERHADGRKEQYGTAVLATIREQPDLLAPITTPITQIVVEESRSRLPVVFMGVTDPVGAGVVDSLDRPRLSTGSSDLCPFSSLLGVIREITPEAKVLGLPYNPTDQPAVFGRGKLVEIAPRYGFSIIDRQVTSASELSTEVRGLAQQVDAVVIAADNLMMENPAVIAASAAEKGKPTFGCDVESVKAGAVAGVSVNYRSVGEAAGTRAVKVLKGEPVGNIPVAVLDEGGMAVNLKAACSAGVNIPTDLMQESEEVFERNFNCQARGIQADQTLLGLSIAVLLLLIGLAWLFNRRSRAANG